MNELDRYAVSLENMEVLRDQIEEQAREIERLEAEIEDTLIDWGQIRLELADLKAQPSGVVLPRDPEKSFLEWASLTPLPPTQMDAYRAGIAEVARLNSSPVSAGWMMPTAQQLEQALESVPSFHDLSAELIAPAMLEHLRGVMSAGDEKFCDGNCTWLDHHPSCVRAAGQYVSAGDERATFEQALRTLPDSTGAIAVAIECFDPGQERYYKEGACSGLDLNSFFVVWKLARTALSANHSEQVREGWQLVPVEPTDAMLEAGDKYIGTPATYKAMLSACPSPAITKDFSQFLSAVMDAAGLIRHGRQSKELSEYLGMKCMEYRGAAQSAGSQGGDV